MQQLSRYYWDTEGVGECVFVDATGEREIERASVTRKSKKWSVLIWVSIPSPDDFDGVYNNLLKDVGIYTTLKQAKIIVENCKEIYL